MQKTSWENDEGEIFYVEYYLTKYYQATQEEPAEYPEIVITSFINEKGEDIQEIPESVYYHIEKEL
jgi:hypothetical protein